MKKILVLGPQEIMPPTDGGREGIHGAIKALAKITEVIYAYPTLSFDNSISSKYLDIGVSPSPIIFEPKEQALFILKCLLRLVPYKFEKYSCKTALLSYESNLMYEEFDAILCCHPHMFRVAEFLKKKNDWSCPIILREHNIEYLLVKGYAKSLTGIKKLAALIMAKITEYEEKAIWARADGVAFLTSTDLQAANKGKSQNSYFIAPEGTPLPEKKLITEVGVRRTLLILLNKNAVQSVLNVVYFLETVWVDAHTAHQLANISIKITGVSLDELASYCSISSQDLTDMKVQCLGFVDSITPLLESSLGLISPTYVGGGIRKKILEAMAHQLPVIASPLDVKSTDYFDSNVNILEFGSSDELISAIVILMDTQNWSRISNAGRLAVETHASWNNFASIIDLRIDSMSQLSSEG